MSSARAVSHGQSGAWTKGRRRSARYSHASRYRQHSHEHSHDGNHDHKLPWPFAVHLTHHDHEPPWD